MIPNIFQLFLGFCKFPTLAEVWEVGTYTKKCGKEDQGGHHQVP